MKTETDLLMDLSNLLLGEQIPLDVWDAETGDIINPANKKFTKTALRRMATRHDWIEIDPSPIRNKIFSVINDWKDLV